MQSVKIRRAKPSDFKVVSELLAEAKLRDPYFTSYRYRKMLSRNPNLCFVAVHQGRIVGSVFSTHDGAFRGHVQKLAVAETHRRKGIGSKLLQIVLQRMKSNEIPVVFAHAEKTNAASIALLRKAGFELRKTHHLIDLGYEPR